MTVRDSIGVVKNIVAFSSTLLTKSTLAAVLSQISVSAAKSENWVAPLFIVVMLRAP